MATVVGTLLFEMAANVARLQSDMQKANSVVQGTMQDFRSAAGLAAKALGAIGVVLSVDSFASMIRGSAEAMEHMRDLGIRTGNTTAEIAALRPAVKAAGGDLDQMGKALGFLAKNMALPSKSAQAAFDELGVAVSDANGKLRASSDVMQEVAEKLTGMEDKTRASALAKVLLGKSGQDLIPVLEEMARLGRQDAAGMNEAGEQAHQFLSRLRQLESQSTALKREFTIGLLPALDSLATALLGARGQSDAAREAGETFGTMMTWAAKIIYGAWEALNLFGKTLAMVAATMEKLATGHPLDALRILKEGMEDIRESAAKAGEAIGKMGEAAGKLPDVRRGRAQGGRRGASAPTGDTDSTDEGGGDASSFVQGFAPGGFAPGTGGAPSVRGPGGQVQHYNTQMREANRLSVSLGQVLEQAGITAARGWQVINNLITKVLADILKSGITTMLKGGDLSSIDLGGILGRNIGSMSSGGIFAGGFAGGGTIASGQWGVVGENGPELVTGGSGGTSVVPAGALGGDFNVSIYAPGADAAKLNQVIAELRALRAAVPGISVNAMRRAFNQRGYATAMG